VKIADLLAKNSLDHFPYLLYFILCKALRQMKFSSG
jgi:hypothetical protein